MHNQLTRRFVALALSAACLPGMAQTATSLGNWRDYEQAGYVAMNALTTPLLHYVRTGQMFDARMLAADADSLLPPDLHKAFSSLRTSEAMAYPDEFKTRDITARLQGFMLGQAEVLKDAGGYLYLANGALSEYDFARKGFPLQLELPMAVLKSPQRLACPGIHSRGNDHARAKACISASNLASEPVFRFLPVEDQRLAKILRAKAHAGDLQYLVAAHVNGKYRVFHKSRPVARFGVFGMAEILGIQPTEAMELLLVDRQDGAILARITAAKAVRKPDAASPQAGAGAQADALDAKLETTPAGKPLGAGADEPGSRTAAAPGESTEDRLGPRDRRQRGESPPDAGDATRTQQAGSIVVGLPADPETLKLDRLLAVLSYAVYSDAGKIQAAERELQELRRKFDRIAGDQTREPTLQQIELGSLGAEMQGMEHRLGKLLEQERLKREEPSRYGAEPQRTARYDNIHQEVYRLADGRHIVVFRGTDNKQDVGTDIELALNPDTVAEVRKRLGAETTVRSRMAGASVATLGLLGSTRPEAFLSADRMVAGLIRSGVPAARIILTGHSLGGGLAQYAGFKRGVQAVVTFNPAPLSRQLMAEANVGSAVSRTVGRHYISTLTQESGTRTSDPVSGKLQGVLGLPELDTLQVVGTKHAVEVCSGLDTPEFKEMLEKQDVKILGGAIAAAGKGGDDAKKKVQAMSAVAGGLVFSKTERVHAAETAEDVGDKAATGLLAAKRCINHPILCPLAAGGTIVAMQVAREKRTAVWLLTQAHKMQPLYESIAAGGSPACLAAGAAARSLPVE